MILERPEIARAFCGERPHGRMILWISATGSAAIFSGVSASAKSPGVTSFTFLSVHCAERTTETRSVYGSLWLSGIGVSGYSSASTRPTWAARASFVG
jgi:hypothetical protein